MTKRFAVFDIDGTIFRWQLYHELFDEFYRLGVISDQDATPVLAARDTWRNRKESFHTYERTLIHTLERSIIGLPESTLLTAADEIIRTKGNQIYVYTKTLIDELKQKNYTILAISGSHQQAVERFAALHGIDVVYGRRHAISEGIITDNITPVYGRKAEILRELVHDHDLTWEGSYAIGDSGGDADMLELVERPIAFNPDQALYERASKEKWPIVIERKNVIYKLEPHGNTFVLA